MSKLFTKSRRNEAKKQFKTRMEFNLQKKKVKKKQLERKYYNLDFKPKTNRKRIDIYSRAMPSKVVRELEKKKELRMKKKIREQQETAFGSGVNVPFKPLQKKKNGVGKKKKPGMKFLHLTPLNGEPNGKNIFEEDGPIKTVQELVKSGQAPPFLPEFPKFD